jgi:type IV pilus assembly protein PilF
MKVSRLMLVLLSCSCLSACVTETQPARPAPASSEEAARANLNLGAEYVRQGRPDLAVDALTRALRIAPRLADAHSTIAIAYDQLGNLELAEQHYERATQLAPRNSAAANGYAVFLCRQGRWHDAEPYFERAIGNPRYPTPDVALTNAGICARNANDLVKADEYFREALLRNNASPGALTGLMEMAYESDNFLRARAFMQRYLESQRANPSVLWMCIQIERELGEAAASRDCEAQLLELFPSSPEAARLQQLSSDARSR